MTEIACGAEAELFRQVGVRIEIEKLGADHLLVELPVAAPNVLHRSSGFPLAQMRWVIHRPIRANVVHAANKVVKSGHSCLFFDPGLVPCKVVALQAQANGKVRVIGPGFVHHVQVAGEVGERHPPVIEEFGHGVVVREANFGQSQGLGPGRVITRMALGMQAQGGVEVVVGEHFVKKTKKVLMLEAPLR